jgi:hypothetical protein
MNLGELTAVPAEVTAILLAAGLTDMEDVQPSALLPRVSPRSFARNRALRRIELEDRRLVDRLSADCRPPWVYSHATSFLAQFRILSVTQERCDRYSRPQAHLSHSCDAISASNSTRLDATGCSQV